MPDDEYEPNRVFGMPRGRGPHAGQGEEPQRVMGIPADWFDQDRLQSLAHPIRAYRRWKQHRNAPGEDNAG